MILVGISLSFHFNYVLLCMRCIKLIHNVEIMVICMFHLQITLTYKFEESCYLGWVGKFNLGAY
jgi:hypothetical protein